MGGHCFTNLSRLCIKINVCFILALFVCVCVCVCVCAGLPRAGGQFLVPKMLVRNSDRTRVDFPRPDSPGWVRPNQQGSRRKQAQHWEMTEGVMNHVTNHEMCVGDGYVCKYVRKIACTVDNP